MVKDGVVFTYLPNSAVTISIPLNTNMLNLEINWYGIANLLRNQIEEFESGSIDQSQIIICLALAQEFCGSLWEIEGEEMEAVGMPNLICEMIELIE
jgi:hypothetical protein